MTVRKQLDIYIDESGNFSAWSNENQFYSIALVLVDNEDDNNGPIYKFNSNLKNAIGGDHFVHVGNLVRGEVPYKEMFREERWKLFYALQLFARYAKYTYFNPTIIKSGTIEETVSMITKALITSIDNATNYIEKYDNVIIHYDYGQSILTGIITATFVSKLTNCTIVKTEQHQSPFMQLADLFAYYGMLEYKIAKSYLTKSESKFFGGIKNFKKTYLNAFGDKCLFKSKAFRK